MYIYMYIYVYRVVECKCWECGSVSYQATPRVNEISIQL